MSPFRFEKRKQPVADLATVESLRNDLTAEEFPEGPYGSALLTDKLGYSHELREDQRAASPFTYENRGLHAGLERGYPDDHSLHDETAGENDSLV